MERGVFAAGRNRLEVVALVGLGLALSLALAGPAHTQATGSPRLVVGLKPAEPFVIKHADGSWSGISFDLWRQIADELELDYELRETDLDGLFEGLEEGSIDVAVGALTVTAEREAICDFTQPFFGSGLGIAARSAPRSRGLVIVERLWSVRFLRALSALGLVLFVAGFLTWVFERRGNPEQFGGAPAKGLGAAFWWSAVTMTTVGYGDMAPRTLGGRIVALVWMFTSVIIVSSFIAAITASLTVNELKSAVRSAEELAQARVGTIADSTSESFLRQRGVRFTRYASPERALEALSARQLEAVVYDEPLLRHLIHGADAPEGDIQVLPEVFKRERYAIAVRSGSPLLERMNRALLEITARETWTGTLERYLGG